MSQSRRKEQRQIPTFLANRLKEEDVKAFTEYFFAANTQDVLKLLMEELEARVQMSVEKSDSSKRYTEPNWDRYQADQVGYRRAYRELVKLLKG